MRTMELVYHGTRRTAMCAFARRNTQENIAKQVRKFFSLITFSRKKSMPKVNPKPQINCSQFFSNFIISEIRKKKKRRNIPNRGYDAMKGDQMHGTEL